MSPPEAPQPIKEAVAKAHADAVALASALKQFAAKHIDPIEPVGRLAQKGSSTGGVRGHETRTAGTKAGPARRRQYRSFGRGLLPAPRVTIALAESCTPRLELEGLWIWTICRC